MRFRGLSVAVVVAASVLGFGAGAAVAAARTSAVLEYSGKGCTTSGFVNNVGVFYVKYNSTYWKLDHVNYLLSPSDSSSDRNNVSASLFGGTNTASLGGTGSAHRDAHWHTIWTLTSRNYYALRGQHAFVSQNVTFDRFGPDPSCTVKAPLP